MAKKQNNPKLLTAQEFVNVEEIADDFIYSDDGYIFGFLYIRAGDNKLMSEMEQVAKAVNLTAALSGEKEPWQLLSVPRTMDTIGMIEHLISGSTYGTLPTPTRTGYSFNGWFTASNGGGTRIIESSVVGTSNITLYAKWEINQYTVSFNSNGGTEVAPVTQDFGTTVAEPTAPTRTGYTFAGWYTDAGLTAPTTFPITLGAADMTLYAKWQINQYTVSFDAGGGSTVAPVTQDYDTTVAEPTAPTCTGYKFTGWYLESELTNAVVWPLTIGAGDITLYAKWTIGQYTVSFDAGGGSTVAPVTQDYGTQVAEPTAPTRTGYTFAGWYTDSGLTNAVVWPLTIGANDITLYAAWTVNQYAVRFESNGGSEVAAVTQDYGTAIAEPTAPTRTGYTFAGWYTDEELATPAAFPITLGTADKTLYAKWTVIAPSGGGGGSGDGIITPEPSYTVNFDSNGADELFSQVVKGGDVINIPPRPIRDGYIFEGWYKDSACTILWDSSEKVTKSMTLFAKWRAVNPEDELNKPDKPQKDTDVPENVNDNPTDNKDDDGDNPKKTELHAVQVPNELEICGIVQDDDGNNPQPADTEAPDELKIRGGGKDKTITKDIATNKKTDAFSWDKLSRIAVSFLGALLCFLYWFGSNLALESAQKLGMREDNKGIKAKILLCTSMAMIACFVYLFYKTLQLFQLKWWVIANSTEVITFLALFALCMFPASIINAIHAGSKQRRINYIVAAIFAAVQLAMSGLLLFCMIVALKDC